MIKDSFQDNLEQLLFPMCDLVSFSDYLE